MVFTLFRDPQARSSALTALGTLQPRAFGSLNRVETLDLASNYYVASSQTHMGKLSTTRLGLWTGCKHGKEEFMKLFTA